MAAYDELCRSQRLAQSEIAMLVLRGFLSSAPSCRAWAKSLADAYCQVNIPVCWVSFLFSFSFFFQPTQFVFFIG
jgi:hypothetical protein